MLGTITYATKALWTPGTLPVGGWEGMPTSEPTYRASDLRAGELCWPLLPRLPAPAEKPLSELVDGLDLHNSEFSFGSDIDEVHDILLASDVALAFKGQTLRQWLSRYQPCLFGRLAAKGSKGFNIDICWVDETDFAEGETRISAKIQRARREWKDRCAMGLSHGFLVMFNLRQLAFAKPGSKLVEVCRRISSLYLIEAAPIVPDIIYTEAMPLKTAEGWSLFKAGTNVFYTGAHRTLNHDRRIPGGVLISVNSPGHLANSLHLRGLSTTLEEAVDLMFDLALRSIGNGGIGSEKVAKSSWHSEPGGSRCPAHHGLMRHGANVEHYSAVYHTDVLVPSVVTSDAVLDPDHERVEIWPWLIIDYINPRTYPASHVNYALFRGHVIPEEAKYFNPWSPRLAQNQPLHGYKAGHEN